MMDMRRIAAAGAVALLAGVLLLGTGCVRVELDDDPVTTLSAERVDLGSASTAAVVIEMGAGQLTVDSDPAVSLMEADFDYRPVTLKPEVDYTVSNGRGELRVSTPNRPGLNMGTNLRYAWDVRLAEGVPMDLAVSMGAGEASLKLGSLSLTGLQVDLGAGDATIDLSGDPRVDLQADINAGVGALTLVVPREAGVRIIGYKDGVGSYQADGFKIDGDYLVNEAYGSATVTYDIVLRRGVGDVVIRMAD
ncbi:MAG: hypothetical protein JXE06_03835 [Coriobacteriia bacterium]|nr:hypothetical protein [Coriobacteriia bacterium]MBN2821686.1 hypothetical protein [Coriobacteriia bacterium]